MDQPSRDREGAEQLGAPRPHEGVELLTAPLPHGRGSVGPRFALTSISSIYF
jgi:hypothetical protein